MPDADVEWAKQARAREDQQAHPENTPMQRELSGYN